MKRAPAFLGAIALLTLASGCGPRFSTSSPTPSLTPSPGPTAGTYPLIKRSAWLTGLVAPATGSVGLPVTVNAVIVYGSSAFKGLGYPEVEVDEARKRVVVKAFYQVSSEPHGVTADMASDKMTAVFTPAATGTYHLELANYIDAGASDSATADVQIEAASGGEKP